MISLLPASAATPGLSPDALLGVEGADPVRSAVVLVLLTMALVAGLVVDYRLLRRARADPRHLVPERRITWLAERPWIWPDFGMLLLIAVGVILLFMVGAEAARLLGWLAPGRHTAGTWAIVVQGLLIDGAILFLAYQILKARGIKLATGLALDLAAWRSRLGQGMAGWLAVLPPLVLAALVHQVVLHQAGLLPPPQAAVAQLVGERSLLALSSITFIAVVLAPLAEEVFFRGILFPLLLRRGGLVFGVALSALVFALIHFHLGAMVPLFVLGVALALGYAISGSLLVPVFMHMVFNAVSVAAILVLRAAP